MATTSTTQAGGRNLTQGIVPGIIGGLIGGVVFGMLMAMMGMLPMVAMLVRSENSIVGFAVHIVISAGIGASFGVLLQFVHIHGRLLTTIAGAVYGMVWWVLGALTLMPLMLGMNQMVFVIGADQWISLMGHVIYGAILGFAFTFFAKHEHS